MDRTLVVLLVEDNPADRRLTAELLSETGITITLCEVATGQDALAFLRRQGDYAGFPRPDMVLLDLGLPDLSGREVLAEICADDELRSIPVVVQTSIDDDQTMNDVLEAGAHEFVTKPLRADQFRGLVEYISEYA